jgi:cobalamin synthase
MSRKRWHQVLVTIVVVLLALAAAFYVMSVVLAPHGRDTAGLFDGWTMFAVVAAIAVGIIDFFVRPLGGRSGDADVMAAAERVRTGSVRTRP